MFSSCATILNGKYQKVPVVTSVVGARVFLNDQLTDTTPCEIQVRRSYKISQEIRVEKKGYKTETVVLKKKLNENTLLGIPYFFIPVAIDAGTGAIIRYQKPDTIQLVSIKKTH
ncbi:MAG: hypothetical protein KG003_12395 [Bacteroidetes bacterium]|nr:hypothetical protein [Bacteroidota bacterium]